MDVVAYILAMANLQVLGGRSSDLDDVSVKMANLGTLANYLKNYPGFSIEDFSNDQVNHVGDVGMYLSNNLRQFCINGEGNPNDEGIVITITYKIHEDTSEDDKKNPNLADHIFLFRKEGLQEDTVRPLLQKLSYYSRPNTLTVIKKHINT